jgi:hypothetical protein
MTQQCHQDLSLTNSRLQYNSSSKLWQVQWGPWQLLGQGKLKHQQCLQIKVKVLFSLVPLLVPLGGTCLPSVQLWRGMDCQIIVAIWARGLVWAWSSMQSWLGRMSKLLHHIMMHLPLQGLLFIKLSTSTSKAEMGSHLVKMMQVWTCMEVKLEMATSVDIGLEEQSAFKRWQYCYIHFHIWAHAEIWFGMLKAHLTVVLFNEPLVCGMLH